MKGCVLWLVLLALGGAMLLAGVVSVAPEQGRKPVNLARPARLPAPPASTVTIHGFNGPKEKPVGLIGAWIGMGLVVLFAAAQVTRSAPAAKAVGIPGTGCAEGLAVIAVGIVLIIFLVAGTLVTLGGG